MRFSEKLRHVLQLSPGTTRALRFMMLPIAAVVLAAAAGVSEAQTTVRIYHGGTIITYDEFDPEGYEYAEAVAVRGGRIVAVGALERVKKQVGAGAEMENLQGKTLIPGFFDGHSHFAQIAFLSEAAGVADLLPPPDGTVDSIEKIQAALRQTIKDHPGVKVIVGNGYDDSQLTEKRQPTRDDLDLVSTDHQIYIIHQSGHYGVANSVALKKGEDKGYIPPPPNSPDGGTVYMKNGRRTGVMGEKAHINMLPNMMPDFTGRETELMLVAHKIYVKQGFTTAEDGRVNQKILGYIQTAAKDPGFKIDVVAYTDLEIMEATGEPYPTPSMDYDHHVRLGGVKLTIDGSPQGRSASFTKPYLKRPDGTPEGYSGIPNYPVEIVPRLKKLLVLAYQQNWQVFMHANGDAALDQVLMVERYAQATVPERDGERKRRTVLIHGQFLRDDQILAIRNLGIFPSLFPMHTFYWGNWYVDIVGWDRARFISPTRAVQDAKMRFSIHSDAPVTKLSSMRLLDSAVNRTTYHEPDQPFRVMGEDQRVSPIVALKALTIWPAYQHYEDERKGSIRAGKVADLVILSHNPLRIEPRNLQCIAIVQTIKDGEKIYPMSRDDEADVEKAVKDYETCAKPPKENRAQASTRLP